VGVGVLVLGVEVAAIYRSHHRAPVATQEATAEEAEPVAPPPIAPAPLPPAPRVLPRPAPAVSPPPPPPPVTAVPDAEVPAPRPQFTSPDIDTVIRSADEHVFDELAMPEATRAAIRHLNEEHQQKLRALREGAGGASGQPLNGNRANVTAFRQTRHEALQELLGPDTGIRFERAERLAAKHLHNQIRAEALGGVSPPSAAPTVQQ
jgi:hypothetical protein